MGLDVNRAIAGRGERPASPPRRGRGAGALERRRLVRPRRAESRPPTAWRAAARRRSSPAARTFRSAVHARASGTPSRRCSARARAPRRALGRSVSEHRRRATREGSVAPAPPRADPRAAPRKRDRARSARRHHPPPAEDRRVTSRRWASASASGCSRPSIPASSKRTFEQEYRETLELVRLAERVGFDSAWVSEHHGSSDGYLPSMLPLLAALAAVTERIELGDRRRAHVVARPSATRRGRGRRRPPVGRPVAPRSRQRVARGGVPDVRRVEGRTRRPDRGDASRSCGERGPAAGSRSRVEPLRTTA